MQNPQRLHVGHSAAKQNEDIVRASRRLEESGRNVQIVPVCINCGKILVKNQTKYCSKSCQGQIKCNIPLGHKVWNSGKTKEEFPQMSNSGVKAGNKPWNTGLTKETDERVRQYGLKAVGKHQHQNDNFHGNCSSTNNFRTKQGYREDIGHFVRSSWEANVARFLKFLGIAYEYEVKRFKLPQTTYCPDFLFTTKSGQKVVWEVSGFISEKKIAKLQLFKSFYPEFKVCLIAREAYKKMSRKYSTIIANWEGNRGIYKLYDKNTMKNSELANSLVIRGMFITMAEIRALRFDVHAKIADLSA